MPSHQWFDLTDKSGSFGVTILSDCKYGSDKPDDQTLRLTLLRTPGIGPRAGYADQATQDWGRHEFVYGLVAHSGDWRREQTDWQAQRLNQPLIAFESTKHPGRLGKTFSIVRLNNDRVRVLALKKAEETDETIVRIVELDGRGAPDVRISFPAPVIGTTCSGAMAASTPARRAAILPRPSSALSSDCLIWCLTATVSRGNRSIQSSLNM